METKSKSEKLIFLGFIFLAASFFGLVYYFQSQNSLLTKKSIELSKREEQLKIQKIENENIVKEKNQVIELVPKNLKNIVDSISSETNKNIKNDVKKIASNEGFENSVIYIQVGQNQTKLNLQNKNFISKLNSKGYNVINFYDIKKVGTDNTVRYFNEEDKSLAEKLMFDIMNEFPGIKLKLKYLKSNIVPVGQLEVWIK